MCALLGRGACPPQSPLGIWAARRALWRPRVLLPSKALRWAPLILIDLFIYLCPSHKPSWEMCSCRGPCSSALNILQAFVVGLGHGGCLFQCDTHLQIQQQTCPRLTPRVWSLFLKRNSTAGLFWSICAAEESNIMCFPLTDFIDYIDPDLMQQIAIVHLIVVVHQFNCNIYIYVFIVFIYHLYSPLVFVTFISFYHISIYRVY